MSKRSAREYLQQILKRYHDADKPLKKAILDEFCKVCGYNRKYAIRLLNNAKRKKKSPRRPQRPGRRKKYNHPILLEVLTCIWQGMNLPCAKRLKAGLPLWVPMYAEHFEVTLPPLVLELLASISASTIDRLMKAERRNHATHGLATTKPGSLLRKQIPIKTNQWDETRPGFLEADTVAHCGTSIAGMFVFTVNIVDIATGWTEQRAVWGKGERGVFQAIQNIEQALPFSIRGFDSDNGGEFLNDHLLKYFTGRKRPVQFTRSRPYHKNDNAHVEGKNWTHVRQYLGYQRFDIPDITHALNELYTTEWRLLHNFFIPSVKLIEKTRQGSKIFKKHDDAKTPLQRLVESPEVNPKTKHKLQALFDSSNPFYLQEQIKLKITRILKMVSAKDFLNKNP